MFNYHEINISIKFTKLRTSVIERSTQFHLCNEPARIKSLSNLLRRKKVNTQEILYQLCRKCSKGIRQY